MREEKRATMGKLYRIEDLRTRRNRAAKQRVFFTRHELNRLLSLYSRRVMNGEWRDYAIDVSAGMAVFSVFRSSQERPTFTIAKRATGVQRGVEFTVSSGAHRLVRNESLTEALKVFDRRLQVVRAGP